MRPRSPRKPLSDRPVIDRDAERLVLARAAVLAARRGRKPGPGALERLFVRTGRPATGFAATCTIVVAGIHRARPADAAVTHDGMPMTLADHPDVPLNGWHLFGDAVTRGWTLH
jgi:hypothetical protein